MSDIVNSVAQGETPATISDNPAGLLRASREAKGLSLEEVAHALKLQPRQVLAMEEGDFKALGSTPHVRGFVRNYARHLGMDPQSILGLLETQAPLPTHELQGPGDTGVAMPVQGGRKPLTWALAASPLVLVALGAGVLYALGVNFDRWRTVTGEAPPAPNVSAAAPASTPAVVAPPMAAPGPLVPPGDPALAPPSVPSGPAQPAVPAAAMPLPVPVPPAATPATLPAAVVAPVAAPALAPVVAANTRRIVLNFLKESWVEVKQGDGRVLLSEKMRGGNTRILEGRPPFTLVIGAANAVQVQYDDRPVDLAPHTKVDVARLTLN